MARRDVRPARRGPSAPRDAARVLAGAWPIAMFLAAVLDTAHGQDEAGAPAADAAAARRIIQQALDAPAAAAPRTGSVEELPPGRPDEPLDSLAIARISAEVAARQLEARRLGQRQPAEALAMLDALAAGLDPRLPEATREQMLRRIERSRQDVEQSSGKRRSELALDAENARIESRIDGERAKRVEVDQRIATLVDEYNVMIDEQRFAEAEAVAKKAAALAPDNGVVRQMLSQSRVIRRLDTQQAIEAGRQTGFLDDAEALAKSATPFVGPIEFPATTDWKDLTKNRSQRQAESRSRLSAIEIEILKRLDTRVQPSFRDAALSEVLEVLGRECGVSVHLDVVGLDQESVRSDTPVTLTLDQPISLKSALKLILEPLHLDYAVRDEVLKITSPRLVKGQVYAATYPVADLVLPIPNFSSDGLGISAALRDGYSQAAMRNSLSVQLGPPPAGINPAASLDHGAVPAGSLAQFQPRMGGTPSVGGTPMIPFGPPPLGGSQADFQQLISLIQQTVQPTTWDSQGGPGAISPFQTNLSLVISQTQEVHEEIADLLEQLRRLQDLQVTIEVRFITLNDTFFERIGVDFDFNIQSRVNEPLNMTAIPTSDNGSVSPFDFGVAARPGGRSQLIGLDNAGQPGVALSPTAQAMMMQFVGQGAAFGGGGLPPTMSAGVGNDQGLVPRNFFSIPFRQNSFGAAAVPQLPGLPDPTTSAANFGFAILSDIEAYFLIQAAQGNTRSNVMQAPKVTLFNGQNAFVSDTRQRPFVTAVVPVVGDFAAAQQPVITVLNEGTAVNVQAVVSNDRRFVRLTLVPFFSQIGRVEQFQFEGSRSSRSKSSDEKSGTDLELAGAQGLLGVSEAAARSNEFDLQSNGTTIQLPEFLFTTVTTTVSVPDGGTVLLGGIKRLREGRNEFGVPILSKIPYINRLFRNVGLGRTTESLMLMVTPRIIIQEEEEQKLLGTSRL
jgi:general secretion pathway protein D